MGKSERWNRHEDETGRSVGAESLREARESAAREDRQRERMEAGRAHIAAHARHSQRLKGLGMVAGGIAHDFNNLLSVIMGNADIIAAEAHGQPLLTHCCGEIQKAAARATDLAAQMLAYSGGGKFVLDELDLSALIDAMEPVFEASVAGRAALSLRTVPDLPPMSGDAVQLQEAASNLVAGAADALSGQWGTIRVETGLVQADEGYLRSFCYDASLAPGPFVYLEVKDNGPGLSQDVIDKLQKPAAVASLGDRGLGLAAATEVARAHHGGLRLLSIPGQGTAVRLHFPALEEELPGTVEEEEFMGGFLDARPGRQRILLVDDEEMVRALGEIILEQNGYAVVTASDGDEAIAAYETYADSLALVLLDMSMPRWDGYSVARSMRAIRADTPIVMCSGYTGVDARHRHANLQVDGFLRKPYHMSELLEIVQQTLRRFDA